jgi:multiple sugar transport system substrate-binding protein
MTKKPLRGITWDHVRGYGPLEASVFTYKTEAGIQTQWEKRSLKNFGDASLEVLAQEYDLIIMDHPHCGTALATRCILPLNEILGHQQIVDVASNAIGPSFDSYLYEQHQWALPIDAACQVSCHRSDLLDDIPLPTSWPDVFNIAELLKSRGLYIGAALCPTDCNCSFLTLCAQFGDPVQEDKFTTIVTAREAVRVLKRLHHICHPKSSTWNPVMLYDYMSTQHDVAYSPLAFGYTNYSRKGYSDKLLSFGTIPGYYHAILGGAGIAVSAYSKEPKAAAEYAQWLCHDHYQSTGYIEAGGQPAHRNAWTNKANNDLTGGFFSKTRSTIEAAYVRPRNLNWPLFQEALGATIHDGLITNKSTEHTSAAIINAYKQYYPNS